VSARADVVIVGAGIAGGALATVLARQGLAVTLLECHTEYRDKVRGEAMAPWGAAECQKLGLEEALLEAGGSYAKTIMRYDETIAPDEAERHPMQLDAMVPGVGGFLDVGHPEACRALSEAAAKAGATVVRGIGELKVLVGPHPEIRYEFNGHEHRLECRLVAGADGRRSTVRAQAGIGLEQSVPRTRAGGLLVTDLPSSWPEEQIAIGTEGDLLYLVFPRRGQRARLYLLWDIAQGPRFRGPAGPAQFVSAFGGLSCVPLREELASAIPAGPTISYPMTDSWTDRIADDGVVLVGDAAGWNDPIIGQGLSVSMRDVRFVAEVLSNGGDWTPRAFAPYAEERRERMRRLRIAAAVMTDLRCTFNPWGAERRRRWFAGARSDPSRLGLILAYLRGPETVPAEVFDPAGIQRSLSES
jgi:2-polyprenyl-6-methoxyphenol hydroxylase-like FAD-dependent oxidoreductase